MFATLFNVEFTNVYFIFRFHSLLNLAQYVLILNVLILGTRCVFKILPTFFWVWKICLSNTFCFFSHIGIIFVERVFYVDKIGVAILEQVYCLSPMRFCRFFGVKFAYKWHAWACVSYHIIQWHFGTDWVIVDFAGLALQCRRFEFCLVIATQKFVWWRRAPVRNHYCCCFFVFSVFIILLFYFYLLTHILLFLWVR